MKSQYYYLNLLVTAFFLLTNIAYAQNLSRPLPSAPEAPGQMALLPPDCNNAQTIFCGDVLNHNNAGFGNNFNRINNYTCVPSNITDDYNGEDRVYKITVPEKKSVRFILTMPVNTDMDMFLFNGCGSEITTCINYSATFNLNVSTYTEVMDVTLSPGFTYYLVVDAYGAGLTTNYTLSVNCSCACAESVTDQPNGFKIFSDDFEDYAVGIGVDEQSTRWRQWYSSSDDAPVEAQNGNSYLHFQQNGGIDPDMLYLLDNKTSGTYRVSFRMFVPVGKSGYYNIQHAVPNMTDGSGGNWAFEVFFNADGTGTMKIANVTVATFKYPQGVWFDVVQLIATEPVFGGGSSLFVNNQFVKKWNFNGGNVASYQLSAINFYSPETTTDYLIDNLCVWEKNPSCQSTLVYEPVCAKNGNLFDNMSIARCALYTQKEVWPCYIACDLGGTMVYRGDNITGQFVDGDFGFTPPPLENCAPTTGDPFFMHVYIFYHDDNNFWDINFNNNGNNQIQKFVFGCKVPTGPNGSCEFKQGACYEPSEYLNNPSASFPCNQLYYITVIGPLNATYSLNIIPQGPCTQGATQVASIPANLSGAVSGNTFGAGQYSECYNGTRPYSGGEKLYRFTLDQPGNVTFTLNSPGAEMGMFLSSFLCGNDCIDFAETTTANSSTTMSTFLENGSYFLVVDKATTAGVNGFTLNIQNQNLSLFYDVEDGAPQACVLNNAAKHIVSINHTAFNFSPQDKIYFLFRDNGILRSSDSLSRNWHGVQQPMVFNIKSGFPGNFPKCSFLPGDTFTVYLAVNENGTRILKEMIPKYRAISTGVNATNTFAGGGSTVIDSFAVKTVVPFGSQTLELNPTSGGTTSSLVFVTNLDWQTEPTPTWIHLDKTESDGAENIQVTTDPNPSEIPRTGYITFYATSNPYVYRQTVKVAQKGVCNPNPQLTINASTTTVCPGATATLTAQPATGMESLFSYKWSNGATTATISVPSINATYAVTISNLQAGCSATKSATVPITVGTLPAANAGTPKVLSCNPGTAQLSGTGSTGMYQWTGPGIVSGNTTLTPTVNQAGVYILTVTGSNGCTATSSTSVSVNNTPPNANAGPGAILLCNPNTVTLNGTGSNDAAYQWNGPGIVSGGNTLTPVVNQIGTYTLTVTANGSGCTASSTTSVTANNTPPNANAGPGAILLCNPNTVTLSGTGSNNAMYNWNGPGMVSGGNTLTPMVNQAGTYTLTVTASSNGCTATSTTSVTANNTPPNANAGPGALLLCNPNTVTLNGTGSSDAAYQWNGPGIVSGGNTLIPVVNQIGTYTLTVTASSNGCTATSTTSVTANNTPPNANAGPGAILLCNPNTVTLNGTSSSVAAYQWNGPGIVSGGNTLTPMVNQIGTYTLTVTASSNGCTATSTTSVTANITPPNANAGPGAILLCNPNTVTLNGTSSSVAAYQWNGPGIVSGGNTLTPVVNQVGTYTLTVTASSNGCTATSTTSVTANITPPNANAGPGAILLCNPNTVTLNGTSSSDAMYNWSGPGIVSGGSTLTPIVNQAGTYSLTVTANSNGCTASSTTSVTTNYTAPTANAGPTKELLCNITSVQLSGSSTPVTGTTYSWSGTGIVSGGNTPNPVVNQTGVYLLTVTLTANGCTGTSSVEVIANVNVPAASAGPLKEITCTNTTVILAGSGSMGSNFSYQWSGPGILSGGNTLTPVVNQAGTYTLTVTNTANNCIALSSTSVLLNNTLPDASAGPSQTLICTPATVILQGTGTAGTNIVYQWFGQGIVANGNTLSPTVNLPGAYTLIVRNTATGCEQSSVTTVIANNTLPIVQASAPQSLLCTPPVVQLAASPIGSNYNYLWSGPGIVSGGNTATPSVNIAGSYTVTVSNATTGCSATSSVLLSANTTPPTVNAGTDIVLLCQPNFVQLQGTASVGTYLWSGPGILSGANTLFPSVNQPGIYTLFVTNSLNGCTASDNVTVSPVAGLPIANAGPSQTLLCNPNTVVLDGSSSSSGTGITYLWSGPGILSGFSTPVVTVNQAGIYTLQVSNTANNCSAVSTVQVTANITPPEVNGGLPVTITCDNNHTAQLNGTYEPAQAAAIAVWSGPGVLSGGNTLTPIVNQSGVYTLTVTLNSNGCVSTDQVTVSTDTLSPNAGAGADLEICHGADGVLGSGNNPAYQYQWMPGAGLDNPTAPAPVTTPSGNQIYTVLITNPANGCTRTDQVSVQSLPGLFTQVLINYPADPVANGSIEVQVSGGTPGYQYQWFLNGMSLPGEVLSSIDGLSEAEGYTLQVTDAKGCTTLVGPFSTVAVIETGDKQQILVHPNPGKGLFIIQTGNLPSEHVIISVSDLTGRLLPIKATRNLSDQSWQADLSNLPDGMYLFHIQHKNLTVVRPVALIR